MQWVQGCNGRRDGNGCRDAVGAGKQQVQQCCGCSRCSSWVAVLQAQRCSLQMDVHGVQTPPRCPEQQTEHGKNKTTPQPHQGRRFACEAFRTRPTGTHPFNTGVLSPHPPPPPSSTPCALRPEQRSPRRQRRLHGAAQTLAVILHAATGAPRRSQWGPRRSVIKGLASCLGSQL